MCTRAKKRKRERSLFLRGIVLELELNITPLTARPLGDVVTRSSRIKGDQ